MSDDWFLVRGATDTPALKKLDRIRKYPAGWAHGDGDPFPSNVADSAERALTIAASLRLNRNDVFPRRDGGLVVSFYVGEDIHDFTLHADGSIDWLHERGDVEIDCRPMTVTEFDAKLVELARPQVESIYVGFSRGLSGAAWVDLEALRHLD